jgi:hypothetical protein
MTPETKSINEFYLGPNRIVPTESGGFWIYFRQGRARFYPSTSEMADRVRNAQTVSVIESARVHAPGTFEPVRYFRNAEGKIGIPPSPDSPLPLDCTPFSANTLPEIDALSAEMNADHLREWESSQEFTDGLNHALGDPRGELVRRLSNSKSEFQRDVIREMLADSDREDRNRANISSRTMFRFREYDRSNL